MNKLAQDRGMFNKLREQSNLSAKILENLNPDFQEMMDKLRATDEKIRSHAQPAKDLVRSAKSYFNRKDYLSCATNISSFHEKCRWISAELQKFISGVDMKHYKFLLDQFDDDQKEQLFGYDPSKEIDVDSGEVDDVALQSQAGISDWWFKATDPLADLAHNLTSDRSRAMRALEKRFSISFLKELKINSETMVIRTQKFLQLLLSVFKKLGTALAKRNVDQYVETSKYFIAKFSSEAAKSYSKSAGEKGYHERFAEYYTKNIVPLKQQHEKLLEAQRAAAEEQSKNIEEAASKKREEEERKKQWEQQGIQQKIQDKFVPSSPTSASKPFQPSTQPGPKMHETAPENLRDLLGKEPEENEPFDLKKTKATFISNIEKFAETDDSKNLMLEILSLSEKLEDIDLDGSLKLLAIAEGMADDYKIAGIFDFLKVKEDKPTATATTPSTFAKDIEEHDPLA